MMVLMWVNPSTMTLKRMGAAEVLLLVVVLVVVIALVEVVEPVEVADTQLDETSSLNDPHPPKKEEEVVVVE